jgi:hypothetical protein
MTYVATATYFPLQAIAPINLGGYEAKTRDEAVSILMDEIREFMRREEGNNWWDDVIISIEHDHVKANYPFEFWAKHFAWSY